MQFEATKSDLLKALSNVNGAVEKKNTLPILQNVKIEAANGRITLSATDMDILVHSSFETKMDSNGSTTVPAQMFYDIVRKIPESSKIVLNQEKPSILQLSYGKSKYNLPCIDSSEFPILAEDKEARVCEIDAKILAKMIDKTRFAISNDETRYYLNGLFLQIKKLEDKTEIRSVATDGHRLALSRNEISGIDFEFGVILPKKLVGEIKKIIESCEKAKVSVSKNKIKFEGENSVILSKLIDGEFPDYEKVLPKQNEQIAKVKKKDFYDAVDRVSTVAADKHRCVKLTVFEGKITFQIDANDGSFAFEEIQADFAGEKIEIGFNSRYLLDVISQIDVEEFAIKFKDNNAPALVEAEKLNAVFVIMPVRI